MRGHYYGIALSGRALGVAARGAGGGSWGHEVLALRVFPGLGFMVELALSPQPIQP